MNPDNFSRRIFAALLACVVLGAAPVSAQPPITHAQAVLPMEPVEIVTHKGVFRFQAEIAATPREQEVGLMYRPALPADRAMLFEMRGPSQEQDFWMKNCPVPIDMLFIEADGTILSIARNAAPYSETPISSGGPVIGVLEIRGGRAAEIGAEPGDQVRHGFFRHG